jgi:hypothetical protein
MFVLIIGVRVVTLCVPLDRKKSFGICGREALLVGIGNLDSFFLVDLKKFIFQYSILN